MDCEHVYTALQSAQTTPPSYDTILTCTAIIVAALVGFFTIASVGLAVVAVLQWRSLLANAKSAAVSAAKEEAKTAREHIAKEAQEEARKWVDIYSNPARMFEHFGYVTNPESTSTSPLPPIAPKTTFEASNAAVGEQLVEALAAEPENSTGQPRSVETSPKEAPNVNQSEEGHETDSPKPTIDPGTNSEPQP